MPRPTNKSELLSKAEANYSKLMTLVDSYDPKIREQEFVGDTLNRNIRDVMAHLHHWHIMMMSWYEQGSKGNKPTMPAEGYTWRTVPELNQKINTMYSHLKLSEAKALLQQSFESVIAVIKGISDKDLFTKKKYSWTGSTSMGAYFISATSSHYDWARKLIKKNMVK